MSAVAQPRRAVLQRCVTCRHKVRHTSRAGNCGRCSYIASGGNPGQRRTSWPSRLLNAIARLIP